MMWHSILALNAPRTFWLPEQASTVAPDVDNLFYFIYWINVIFTILVVGLMVWFMWRYRHRKGNEGGHHSGHNNALEVTWTVIPTIIVGVIYYWGFKGFLNEVVEPPGAMQIKAVGQMWKWQFVYPNGGVSDELHVPLNKPVRMVLESQDVIHALFIPAFRVKKDVVPGRYNRMWFQATKAGTYDIFCADYCGIGHSIMHTTAVVDDDAHFATFLEDAANPLKGRTYIDGGKRLYQMFGCSGCHSVNGERGNGPSWKDVYGSNVPLEGGATVLADDAYVRESVEDPGAKIVQGFSNIMPSFKGRLNDDEIKAITWYLKSISSHVPSSELAKGNELVPDKNAKSETTEKK